MNKTGVIFDLDGTLLYTLDDLSNSVNYALEKHGYPQRTIEEVMNFIGNGVKVLMRRSGPKGLSEEKSKELLDTFRTHYLEHMYDNTRTYDGVMEMLREVKEAGFNSAIVSNKLDPAVKKLNEKFFKQYIDIAIGAPSDHKKPDPFSVLDCMSQLGTDVTNSIYIGDTDVDLETAHNAGLKCIGVAWGFRGRKYLEDISCDFIVDTPNEVLPLLKTIFLKNTYSR
ncbi:MAG: HAD family hydrolase [Paludibacteraceae bacterium]|nr:HAD family hydrolase [Paludibacteraceae bacterium]